MTLNVLSVLAMWEIEMFMLASKDTENVPIYKILVRAFLAKGPLKYVA